MKKVFFLALIVISVIANNAFAYSCSPKTKDPCFDDSDLFKKDKCAVFGNAEFLYWRADAGALEYAFQYNQSATVGIGTTYGLGDYKIADYDYDPGFRLAFGWYNAPDYWRLYGQFLWLKITGSDSEDRTDVASQPLVGSFFQNAILGAELQSASSKLNLNHELGDILVARVFVANPHLRLRLFGGFTGGRIKQTFDVTYTDTNALSERIFNKWRFLGIGFRLGLDFDWFWGNNFYLTGKLSTAPLVGKHKNHSRITADTSGVELQNIEYSKYRGAFNIDAYIGPSYHRSFDCGRMEIFLGYELDGWMNVHEIIRPTGSTNANALTTEQIATINSGMFLMHGLSARLTLDY